MRKYGRTDNTQTEIVKQMRSIGFTVAITSAVGSGFPDAVASMSGTTFLVEFKSKGGKLTAEQVIFHNEWHDDICIAETIDDVLLYWKQKNRGGRVRG